MLDPKTIQDAIDNKTKPVGALGRIEDLAHQIARIQDSLEPNMDACRLIIFAGDHGMAAQGVSAYPQAVTRQMGWMPALRAIQLITQSFWIVVLRREHATPLVDPR